MLIVLDDLTEQERRELAEREFVSNAAHELRTPLTTIIGAVEVLQAGAKEDPAERDRFLAHIEREAERLAGSPRAAHARARARGTGAPRFEQGPSPRCCTRSREGLRPHDGVLVDVECPTTRRERSTATCSSRRCATSARTRRSTRRPDASCCARTRRLEPRVEVEDTGAGMSAEMQRHVFDRFYRGKDRDAEGFGLGLAIVRQAVRSLGGRIELDSSPGEGTRVRIVLERARTRGTRVVAFLAGCLSVIDNEIGVFFRFLYPRLPSL